MELAMPPEHVGPMRRAYFPRMLVQSEGWFQERKKLTMIKAPAYLKAGKTKKSAMLEYETCESVQNPFALFRNILWHILWHVNHSLDSLCCARSKEGKKRARIRDAIQRTSRWDLRSTMSVLAKWQNSHSCEHHRNRQDRRASNLVCCTVLLSRFYEMLSRYSVLHFSSVALY
jgi:hypothetical protein